MQSAVTSAMRPTLLLLAISFTSAQEASSGVASAGGQQCPTSHPNKCLSESDVNKPIHYESDVNKQIHPKYFHGPCCDKDPDCICNAQHLGEHCGEGCDDGAHALPHEPVPVGEPDASCKVSAGTVGDLPMGPSWGGLHVCTSDGAAGSPPLTGAELAVACLAVCLADPQCRSFGIGSPKIADAYRYASGTGGHAYNCAIEYYQKTDPAVQSLRASRAPVGSDVAKEVNCWTNYEMEGTCTTQPTWAPDKAVKCFDPSAALGGGVAGRGSIGGMEDWFRDGGNYDPVEEASFLARLNAIDHDTCDDVESSGYGARARATGLGLGLALALALALTI